MDPIAIVVSALAAGAAAALKDTAESAIRDAYSGLKELIRRRYERVDVDTLEKKPESQAKQDSVAEDLRDAGATGDEELVDLARRLLEVIGSLDPGAAAAVGVDLEDIRTASLDIEDVTSSGTGVRARRLDVQGPTRIKGVRAGPSDEDVGDPRSGQTPGSPGDLPPS